MLSHKLALAAIYLACATQTLATPVSGDQSGTWALAGSPFELIGDVRIPPGQSLTIDPGVEIIGMGNYKITADTGATLTAVGTTDNPIHFTALDTNNGWRGLRLESANDQSTISYCLIEYAKGSGPYPEVRGGAIMAKNCSPTITHNTIRHSSSQNANRNGTGGGVSVEFSSALIAYNLITDNAADSGGGICTIEYGSPTIRGNIITNNNAFNAGGGMYFGARSTPLVENNIITGNSSAGWGGGGINCWTAYIFHGTFPTIRHNIIARNSTSTAGGGLYCRYDRAVITNNLIAFNTASRGGGIHALNQGGSAPIVTNTILWANAATTGPQIDLNNDTGSQIQVSYSNVQGGYTGTGNVGDPPAFADPDADDFHILPGSSCIDAGDNFALDPSVQLDFDQAPRYVDDPNTPDTGRGDQPIIDIGPYEFQASCPADFNNDGSVNTLDFLAFLNAYNNQDPRADFNNDGTINTLDFLAFLNAFNAGCE